MPTINNKYVSDDKLGEESELCTFTTGARREYKYMLRYDLVPIEAYKRLVERYTGGARKYGPHTWEPGMPFSDVYNHLIEHLNKWRAEEEPTDDHLSAVAWAAFALMTYEDTHPEMDDIHINPPVPQEASTRVDENANHTAPNRKKG